MEKVTTETASKATKVKKSVDWRAVGYQASLVALNGLIYGIAAGVGGLAVTKVAGSFSSEGSDTFLPGENVVPMKKSMLS